MAIVETVSALTDMPEQAVRVRPSPLHDNLLCGFDGDSAANRGRISLCPAIDASAACARYAWVLTKLCHQHGLDPSRRDDPASALPLRERRYAGLPYDVVTVYGESIGGNG